MTRFPKAGRSGSPSANRSTFRVLGEGPEPMQVIGPSPRRALSLLGSIVCAAIGVLIVRDPASAFIGWAIVVVFTACGLMQAAMLITSKPRLILTAQGLEFAALFKTRRWPWVDLGTFAVVERALLFRSWRAATMYYAAAYSSRTGDNGRTGTCRDADILIPLTGLRGCHQRENAEEIVAGVNGFRRRYGPSEFDTSVVPFASATAQDTAPLLNGRRMLRRLIQGTLVIVVVVTVFLFKIDLRIALPLIAILSWGAVKSVDFVLPKNLDNQTWLANIVGLFVSIAVFLAIASYAFGEVINSTQDWPFALICVALSGWVILRE